MLALLFGVALPLLPANAGVLPANAGVLAADTGAAPARAPAAEPALIPQPVDRFADRGEKINLREAKDGSGDLVYEATGFTARIAADGSVTFSEKRVTNLTPAPWWPSRAPLAVPSLQSSLTMFLKGKKAKPPPIDDRLPPPETTSIIPEVSRFRPDAREGCNECPSTFVPMIISPYGRGDLTDALQQFSGQDPNRFQKASFLAATHDRRIEMAVRTHARYVRTAYAELPGRLQLIACESRLTPPERRAILVALGREMDTQTPKGKSAAGIITTFVGRYDSGEISCTAPPQP